MAARHADGNACVPVITGILALENDETLHTGDFKHCPHPTALALRLRGHSQRFHAAAVCQLHITR